MSQVLLDEVCDFFNGGAWSDKEYVTKGIPVLKVTNCKSAGFQIEDINYLPNQLADKYQKNKLELDDVIIATVGSHPNLVESAAGRSYVVNRQIEGFYLNQNAVCIRTKDANVLNQKYLGYLCRGYMFRHYIQNRGRGAANQMRIAIGAIKEYKFELPDIEIQRRIADILSRYDNLIENNQNQIKLLEEAAQRLYKEWFVDLRFPGYEDCKIVDGVPEGWHMGTLDEIIEYHDNTRKPLSSMQREAMKGSYRYYGAAGILDFVNQYLFDGTYLLLGEDGTVITKDGRPVLQYVTGQFWVNNHAHVLTGKDGFSTEYIYMMFSHMGISDVVTGVAQPKISQGRLSAKKVLIPDVKLSNWYQIIAKPYFDKVLQLEKQINALKEARDRLLPKLMSGELEI